MKTLPELLTGFKPKYEGQSLADYMAGRDSPESATVQGNDYQGRLRRFDSAEEMAANIRQGRASYDQASADLSNSIQFGREAPGGGFDTAAFMQPQASQNIPSDVMEASMTGSDPKRLSNWANSNQGKEQGGLAGLKDLLDPKAQARKERDKMQTAMERKKAEGVAKANGADPNQLAEMDLATLQGFNAQQEEQRVVDRYNAEQQQAQSADAQKSAFSAMMADIAGGSNALATGADMPSPTDQGSLPSAAGQQATPSSVLDDPVLKQLAQLHQAGVPVSPSDVVRAIQSGNQKKESELEFVTSPTGNNFVRFGNQVIPDRVGETGKVPTSVREAETLANWKEKGQWGKIAAYHKTIKEYNNMGSVTGERPMTAADAKALYAEEQTPALSQEAESSFPQTLFKDGRHAKVSTAKELAEAKAEGWE